jgi:hypothetical protein
MRLATYSPFLRAVFSVTRFYGLTFIEMLAPGTIQGEKQNAHLKEMSVSCAP